MKLCIYIFWLYIYISCERPILKLLMKNNSYDTSRPLASTVLRQWSRGCRTAWRRRLGTDSKSLCLNKFASPGTKCRLVYLLPRFLKDLYWRLFLNWDSSFGQDNSFKLKSTINQSTDGHGDSDNEVRSCFKQLHSLMSFICLCISSPSHPGPAHVPSLQTKSVCLSSPFGLWCTTVTSDCMWSRSHFTVAGTTLKTVTNVQTFNQHYCWA